MILNSYFQGQNTGFYVDIGAHHPTRYSNTYFFYKRGWRGINVDATPGSMDAFKRLRPLDVNVEAAVSRSEGMMPFFMFEDGAFNLLDPSPDQVENIKKRTNLLHIRQVPTLTLRELFLRYAPPTGIDFLSIDIEGHELAVLPTNDWARFRPKVIVAEDLGAFDIATLLKRPLAEYLLCEGYVFCGKCHHSVMFVEQSKYVAAGLTNSDA